MRRLVLISAVWCAACVAPEPQDAGTLVSFDAGTSDAGVSDSGVADAGLPDAGALTPTWNAEIAPILWARCATCHAPDAGGGAPWFLTSYASLSMPAARCPGENLGACIVHALEQQAPEGSACRTYTTPFHREGWQPCFTPAEVQRFVHWGDAGFPEN